MPGNARRTCLSFRRVFQEDSLEDDNEVCSWIIVLFYYPRCVKVYWFSSMNQELRLCAIFWRIMRQKSRIMRIAQYFLAKFLNVSIYYFGFTFNKKTIHFESSIKHLKALLICHIGEHFLQQSGGSIYCENVLYLREKKFMHLSRHEKKKLSCSIDL